MTSAPVTRADAGATAWQHAVHAAAAVPDRPIQALYQTLNYLCAAQLYLAANVRGERPLQPADLKDTPRGHWGVCPPVNWILAHLTPIIARTPHPSAITVVHGAGHAGPAVFAHGYLTQTLPLRHRCWTVHGLRELVTGFPHTGLLGGEITPLAGAVYTGGQLGPALAVAQGMALDDSGHLIVPLIGDGECETGATAAAWTARRALIGTGRHGSVLPVVLLNGQRMGGPSLLAQMTPDQIHAYFDGLGYEPLLHHGDDITSFRALLATAVARLRPLDAPDRQPLIVLTLPKGATGPATAIGTPAVHKTPLPDPHDRDFPALARWLASYHPTRLLASDGSPTDLVRQALPTRPRPPRRHPAPPPTAASAAATPGTTSGATLGVVLADRAHRDGFRLFSPDELASNRIDPGPGPHQWIIEILNEEICHAWLQGYTETGRDAVLATYEAFAPINTSVLAQHLKHRRLAPPGLPSINYLITSLGWHNTYTHQNPGLASHLIDLRDPAVHVYTPADAHRAAATLTAMIDSRDQANVLITSKHPLPQHPDSTLDHELAAGIALWPHLSTSASQIVLASAGDIAARELTAAARTLADQGTGVRYLHIHDLTVLDPGVPHGLSPTAYQDLFGSGLPVLVTTITRPSPVQTLLAARHDADRAHVIGFTDPPRPLTHPALLQHTGMRADLLTDLAHHMIEEVRP
ncbi:phosphoketolase [Actinomadura hibisca]|uniref:phosphoketolase family protein n=1 Tax=Actinomadura hibisca TaxID=68565 RepID=UPI0008369D38|nr:phosphoketolase [Actinomadura hibisca]